MTENETPAAAASPPSPSGELRYRASRAVYVGADCVLTSGREFTAQELAEKILAVLFERGQLEELR